MPRLAGHRVAVAVAMLLAGASLLPSSAVAAPGLHYQDVIIGERAAGMGGAFTALANEATGAYYNPAGIVVEASNLMQLAMSAYKLRRRSVPLGDLCGQQLDEASSGFFGFPASLGYVRPFSAGGLRHAVAFTLVVPAQEKDSASKVLTGVDCGGTRVDYGTGAVSLDRTFRGGISYALKWRWLQVGVTAGLAARTVSGTEVDLAVLENSYPAASLVSIDTTAWSMFFQLGAIIEPIKGLRFGVSATLPQVQLLGEGRLDVAIATGVLSEWQASQLIVIDDAKYNLRVPLKLAAGVAWIHDGWLTLAVDVSLHLPVARHRLIDPHPSLGVLNQALPEVERRLVVNVNAGAEMIFARKIAVRAGVFTNFTATPDLAIDDPANDDRINFVGFSAGMSWISKKRSTLGFNLQLQYGSGSVVASRIGPPAAAGQALTSRDEVRDASGLSLIISFGGSYDLRP